MADIFSEKYFQPEAGMLSSHIVIPPAVTRASTFMVIRHGSEKCLQYGWLSPRAGHLFSIPGGNYLLWS